MIFCTWEYNFFSDIHFELVTNQLKRIQNLKKRKEEVYRGQGTPFRCGKQIEG
jgi:hypothetical protein